MACLKKEVGNWVSPRAGLDFLEKRKFIACIGIRTPGRLARGLVTMLTASVLEIKQKSSVFECKSEAFALLRCYAARVGSCY